MEEGGSGGWSEVEKKKRPEGENKVKQKMKTASQLEILEKSYAGVPLPPSSPASQVSFGTTTNSNSAASPTITLGPRPTIIGFGHSGGARLNMEGHLVATAAAAILCTKLLSH